MYDEVKYWIEKLNLLPHKEGGYFNRYYTSNISIKQNSTYEKKCLSKIHYLLEKNQKSVFHKLAQDEVWDFLKGSPLKLYLLISNEMEVIELSNEQKSNSKISTVVEKGVWMAAESLGEYSLVTCSCSPAFEENDFEFADREELITQYPHYKNIINNFTY